MKKELLIAALGIGVSGTLDAATQQEVDTLLAKIAKSPPPKTSRPPSPEASCYSVAAPPERTEYVCPACGTKTLYSFKEEHANYGRCTEVHAYRAKCEKLRRLGWDVKLDETFMCAKCRKPGQPESFHLEVTIDGKTTRTQMYSTDLDLLLALAEGKLAWEDSADTKKPLKPELPRLRKLLGVTEEEGKKSAPSFLRKLLGLPEENKTPPPPTN